MLSDSVRYITLCRLLHRYACFTICGSLKHIRAYYHFLFYYFVYLHFKRLLPQWAWGVYIYPLNTSIYTFFA